MNTHARAAGLRRGHVRLPDAPPVECWLRPGERWNGFAIPYFDIDQLPNALSMLRKVLGTEHVLFDGRLITVTRPDDYPFEEDEPVEFERESTGLWCIGGWLWTWEDAEDGITAGGS